MATNEDSIRRKIIESIRPWGSFRQYAENETCTVKILRVHPNQMLSKQRHKNRDELWVVLDEGLTVELNNRILEPKTGDEIVIRRNVQHRLSSRGVDGRVLEVAFGYFDEDDIVRLDDIYGRE